MAICRFVAPLHSNLDPGTFSSCHPLERKRSLLMVVQLLGWILGGRGHNLHFGLSPHLGNVDIKLSGYKILKKQSFLKVLVSISVWFLSFATPKMICYFPFSLWWCHFLDQNLSQNVDFKTDPEIPNPQGMADMTEKSTVFSTFYLQNRSKMNMSNKKDEYLRRKSL